MPFFLANRRYPTFERLFAALSTLGSGYVVGFFDAGIRQDFGLSHADIGFFFAVTTLAGGAVLMWLGRKIDDSDPRP